MGGREGAWPLHHVRRNRPAGRARGLSLLPLTFVRPDGRAENPMGQPQQVSVAGGSHGTGFRGRRSRGGLATLRGRPGTGRQARRAAL